MDEVISTTEQQPNRVADAAEMLQRFIDGEGMIVTREDTIVSPVDVEYADERAAIISIQLLAIASQLERIADALEIRS